MSPEVADGLEIALTEVQMMDVIHCCSQMIAEMGEDASQIEGISLFRSPQSLLVEFRCANCIHHFLGTKVDTALYYWCLHNKLSHDYKFIKEEHPVPLCISDVTTVYRYITQGFQPISSLGVAINSEGCRRVIDSRISGVGVAETFLDADNQIDYLARGDGRIVLRISDREGNLLFYLDEFLNRGNIEYLRCVLSGSGYSLTIYDGSVLTEEIFRFLQSLYKGIRDRIQV